MNVIARRCLLHLADFLETEITDDVWCMATYGDDEVTAALRRWVRDGKKGRPEETVCGTACCAAGWLIALHGKALKLRLVGFNRISYEGENPVIWADGLDNLKALARGAGITVAQARSLFDPDQYREEYEVSDEVIEYEPSRAAVAKRLREVVDFHGGPMPETVGNG